ncbi:hypothetical protein TrRE_jg3851, partial [Triparma retinervis]
WCISDHTRKMLASLSKHQSKDLAIQTANNAEEEGIRVRSFGSHVSTSDSGVPVGCEGGGYLIVAVANREQIDALKGEKQIEMSATFMTGDDFKGDSFTYTMQEAIDGKYISDYVVIAAVFTTTDEDNKQARDHAGNEEDAAEESLPDGLEDENSSLSSQSSHHSGTVLNLEKKRQKAVIQYIEENHISNRATLVFYNNVRDAEQAAKDLNGIGVNAETVTAATKASTRTQIRKGLSKGDIEVVCLVGCWNEGISVDEVKTIIYADPRSSQTNIIQTFSRANRLHESKPYFKVVIPVCESDFDQDKFINTVKAFAMNDERVRKAILDRNYKRFTVEVLAEEGFHEKDADEEEKDAEADRAIEILYERIFDRFESFDSPSSSVIIEDGLGRGLVVDLTSLNVKQGQTRSIEGMWKMQNYTPPLPPLQYAGKSPPSPDGNYPILDSTIFLANSKLSPTLTTATNRVRMVNAGAGDTLIVRVEGEHLAVGRDGVLFPGKPREDPMGKYVLEPGSRLDLFIFSPNATFYSDCGSGISLDWLGSKTDVNCWRGGRFTTSGPGYPLFFFSTTMPLLDLQRSKASMVDTDLTKYTNPSYYHPSQSLLSLSPHSSSEFTYYTSPTKVPSPPSLLPSSLYGFNGLPYDGSSLPSATVCLGRVYEWSIVNPTSTGHPFHMHTNHFQVASYECGDPPTGEGGGACDAAPSYEVGDWRDTVMVPSPGTIKVRFRPTDWQGDSFAHCHIFGHEDRGMAVKVKIVEDC